MEEPVEYVGFWARVVAALVDTVLLSLVLAPVLFALYGPSFYLEGPHGLAGLLFNYVLPAAAFVAFWIARQATPGKMVIGAKIVDAATGGPLRPGQAVLRYVGYYVSAIPFCLGLIWVGIDKRKQGWHDKIAGTLVVRTKK
ncbi:MAG: RDD family protein [Pelomonas sp.]|nr:RDD family protein [Roseateles sp.]